MALSLSLSLLVAYYALDFTNLAAYDLFWVVEIFNMQLCYNILDSYKQII
jgi:hypothetical protein